MFASIAPLSLEVDIVSDDRLMMLKWHHLKVELDNREKQWPENTSYEFDYDKQTVTWLFGERANAPERLIWHLTDEDLSEPKPVDVANRIIDRANELVEGVE
jgi:hypothetical protein